MLYEPCKVLLEGYFDLANTNLAELKRPAFIMIIGSPITPLPAFPPPDPFQPSIILYSELTVLVGRKVNEM